MGKRREQLMFFRGLADGRAQAAEEHNIGICRTRLEETQIHLSLQQTPVWHPAVMALALLYRLDERRNQ